jgi:hypothetical protein
LPREGQSVVKMGCSPPRLVPCKVSPEFEYFSTGGLLGIGCKFFVRNAG